MLGIQLAFFTTAVFPRLYAVAEKLLKVAT